MQKSLKELAITLCVVVFVGCTSIKVQPLKYDPELKEINLLDNPKVIVEDFVPVMEQHFSKHGLALKRVPQFAQLNENEYGIRYSARRSWDFATYLSLAYVNIYKGNKLVAEGNYHLIGGGGFSLFKWQGTETKLAPMYDELLKNYPTKYKPE